MEPREKLDQARHSDFTVRPGAVLFTLPQSSLSFKESNQASSSANDTLLAVFLSELDSGRKDCLTSCHQHVRKLGCLGNYRFPMVFPLFFSRNFYFFLTEQKPHKNSTALQPTKMQKTMVMHLFSGNVSYIAFEVLLPTPDLLTFPRYSHHPPRVLRLYILS